MKTHQLGRVGRHGCAFCACESSSYAIELVAVGAYFTRAEARFLSNFALRAPQHIQELAMHKSANLRSLLQTTTRRALLTVGLVLGLSACIGTAGAAGAGGDTWQEEVLLHDGQRMVIERSQTYGGRSEPGQSGPIADHTIRFIVPKGQQTITWNSPYDHDIGRTSFFLLAVHVKDQVPYVVAEPNLCLSYNKWGRPNPPYVIFKWEANGWQRIGMDALPTEFTTTNVIRSIQQVQARQWSGLGVIKAEKVAQINGVAETAQYRSILREAMPAGKCPQYSSSPKAPD